jgi:uncharacterized protein (DUF58 family)
MNSKVLTLSVLTFGLVILGLLTRIGDLAWMALPFLIYLGLGILKSPDPGKIRLSVVRSVEVERNPQGATVKVNIELHNQGDALDQLYLSDQIQAGMQLTEGRLWQVMALQPGDESSYKYSFQSNRGSFTWETLNVVASDPFGLVETSLNLPASATVQIQPELNKFRPFRIRPQRTLHSAGSIPGRLGGSGTDFWGIREYHPGDPLRRLDWRLTARHPRKFFTKEFEQEEIADIGLILDARRKTDMRIGEDSLFEHSARAAASLAEVFLRQGNRVSMFIYGEPTITIYPGYGKRQLNRILRSLSQASTESNASLDSLQFLPIRMFSSHSLIIILSPLARNDWPLFPRLRAFGYQVLLISPDPFDYARSVLPTDQISRLACRLARVERRLEISKIIQLWIPVIDWKVCQPLAPLVRNTLSHIHIQQQR